MKCSELYEEMKEAPKFFGLRFHEMDQMEIDAHEGYVIFRYGKRSISVNL